MILDEHMTFSFCIDSRYTSGSKSLSSIIGKDNVYGNFTYDMNSQLYDASVIPTMLYGAEVVGYINPSNFEEKNTKKSIEIIYGVHNSTPIQAMMGDMGWTDIYIKELLYMLRYWNSVIIMDNACLERRIFMWDYNKGGDNWSNKVSIILNSINCMHVYRNKTWCDIK